MEPILSNFVTKYEGLESQLSEKSAELVNLREKNSRLRHRLGNAEKHSNDIPQVSNTCQPLPCDHAKTIDEAEVICERKGTLLMGSSIIHDIRSESFDCVIDPICVRGVRVSDLTAELLSMPKEKSCENIILHVGSNDCTSDFFDSESFADEYNILVNTAKTKYDIVVISSLCPRLDDKLGNITTGNSILSKIANDENCLCIDHDDSFRVPSGAVNTLLYNRDGINLSKKGTVRLTEKFDFKCIVKNRTVKKDGNVSGNSRQAGRHGKCDSRQLDHQRQRANGPVRHGHSRHYVRHHSGNGYSSQNQRSNVPNYRDSKDTGVRNRNLRHSSEYDFHSHVNDRNNVTCWYCGESTHVAKNCRHGTYIVCNKCDEYGHKQKHCQG